MIGKEKKEAWLTVLILCGILLTFTVTDLIKADRVFSETENRLLATRPKYSTERLLNGSLMEDYETYITDQFVGRDKWISIKTGSDILLQKKEINGVYLGKDHYLIERHSVADFPPETVEKKMALLENLVDKWDAKVMLVPTADNILTDKLPPYAERFDQKAFLETVREQVGEEHYVDVYNTLWEHRSEAIYYRTDHHWTTRGACYGYEAWAESMGLSDEMYDTSETVAVSTDFRGTLHSKINMPVKADTIEYLPVTERTPVRIAYDMTEKKDSFYEKSYLRTKNQYGYFLDDNHAFVEIRTKNRNGKTLFVIKDSYANCLIPLLAMHYERVYVVDLRYMNGKLFPFMEKCEPKNGMDVLVLYNCVHFLEEFQYYG